MKLKVLTWNVRRAKKDSLAWRVLSDINADIILLQEVVSIPEFIYETYSALQRRAVCRNGQKQTFNTVVLAKGKISKEIFLRASQEWVNKEIEFFAGNLLACEVIPPAILPIKVMSVHSPAWPIDKEKLKGIDLSGIKLKLNPELWCTEILWGALKCHNNIRNERWIIAGDFNSSVTFDYLWKGGPRGNQEIVDRMNSIGFRECIYSYTGRLTPTFKNPKGGQLIHQLDHVYITAPLLSSLISTYVLDNFCILERSISDHLPIVSNFLITE